MSYDETLPDLLRRFLQSDKEEDREGAARQLVEQLYPQVIRIVRAHLPKRETEEDMAQEVFMKMFARLHQYRADKPFEHWLSRMAVTTCIDHLRAQKVRPELRWSDLSQEQSDTLEACLEDTQSPPTPDSLSARDLVQTLLMTLEPTDRLILQWLDLEQLSVEEIEKRTGFGKSFIKVRAFRARAKLRSTMNRFEKENS